MKRVCWHWRVPHWKDGNVLIGKNEHHPSPDTITQIKELRAEKNILETLVQGTAVETKNEVQLNLWQPTDPDFLLDDWKALSPLHVNPSTKMEYRRKRKRTERATRTQQDRDIRSRPAGQRILWEFFHEAFWNAHAKGQPTFYSVWNEERTRRRFWSAWLGMKRGMNDFNLTTLRRVFALKFSQPTSFPPSVALDIFETFRARHVLDFCHGFGGRLLGFLASTCGESYVGIDPNPLLQPMCESMMKWAVQNESKTKKTVQLIQGRAEDKESYDSIADKQWRADLILTSPPYFDTEMYNDADPEQSSSKYTTLERWQNEFLFPSLHLAVTRCLRKPGGHLLINFKQMKQWKINVANNMCRYIEQELGLERLSDYHLRLGRRVGRHHTNKINQEIIFTFKLK